MKHYLSIVFLFLLLLVACDPAAELGTPFHRGQEVVLTAAIGEQRPQMMPQKYPNPQRISGKDAPETIDLLWDEGDEIRVHVGEASSIFTLIDGAGTDNASFMGTMPASGSSYEVTYPKENNDDLLLQQTYVPDGIAKGLMKMSTTSPGTIDKGFTLQAEHAVLGLQLTGNREIGKIVLSKNDADGQAASPSYTLLCPKVTLTETATLFYIVLPAGIWEKGFTVDVYGADNTTIIDTFVTNKRFEFIAANATTMAEKDVQNPPKRIGVFSVGAGKKVSFSQGNLQYTQSTDTWQFAEHQYDFIGEGNIQNGQLANRIDLFGWSADNTTAPFGVSMSTNNADYAGEFVDWGTNIIQGDAANTWRTLSADEWEYVFKKRKNASDLYGVAQVAGVNGMIILPDHWEASNGIVFKSGLHSSQVDNYSVYQSFTYDQWLAMENAGAVFLPALGYRDGTNVEKCNTSGYYWSNTASDEKTAYRLYFYSYFLNPNGVHSIYRGRSVRLVHDTIVPKVEPEYVDLGLSVKWATFNVGASKPEDYGDYFAWGETEPKEEYNWATYKWCEGTDKTMTKYCTNSEYGNNGFTDNKTILEPEDDAAHVLWGGKWRTPTDEELTELREKCTWTYTTRNAIEGYNIEGPNGNSIFLPAAGFYFVDGYKSYGNGDYWSTKATNTNGACHLYFYSDLHIRSSSYRYFGFPIRAVYDDVEKHYRNGITQANWDAATELWGHGGRGHAPTNQSCIQGTIVHGIRLKIARKGSLDVYKVPSLLEKTEDNFELVAILTTDSTGVQDFDFDQPIYIAPNEYLVFGKPSAKTPTLLPCYINNTVDDSFPDAIKGLTHRIGSEKVASSSKNASLMVEFY